MLGGLEVERPGITRGGRRRHRDLERLPLPIGVAEPVGEEGPGRRRLEYQPLDRDAAADLGHPVGCPPAHQLVRETKVGWREPRAGRDHARILGDGRVDASDAGVLERLPDAWMHRVELDARDDRLLGKRPALGANPGRLRTAHLRRRRHARRPAPVGRLLSWGLARPPGCLFVGTPSSSPGWHRGC